MSQMPKISPYLTVADGEAAIRFYETVFDARLSGKMMAEDGKRIMHATLIIFGEMVMLSEEFPEYGNYIGPDKERGSPVAVSLRLDSASEVDRIYDLALKNGGQKSAEPEDMFWGDRFAQLIDVAGHRWMLVAKLSDSQT